MVSFSLSIKRFWIGMGCSLDHFGIEGSSRLRFEPKRRQCGGVSLSVIDKKH